jgi:hypothetical protein
VSAFLFFEEPDQRGSTKKETELTKFSEEQPLIENGKVERTIKENVSPPLYRNAAVMTTLFIYFFLQLILEYLLSSTATVASFYFDWDTKRA